MPDDSEMNNDDQLLRELARLASEEKEEDMTRLDKRWDALSSGELDQGDEADLRSLADSSTEMRAAWEAFRPVDQGFRRGLAQRLWHLFTRRRFARRSAKRWWPLAVAAALLATLAGLLFPRFMGEPIPPYSLEAGDGLTTRRSSDEVEGTPRLAAQLRFDLRLRPDTSVADEVALGVFLEQDGILRPWEVPKERVHIANTGAIKLSVFAGELGLRPGPATLWLTVSRPHRVPDIEKMRNLRAGSGNREVRLLRQDVILEPDSGGFGPPPSL